MYIYIFIALYHLYRVSVLGSIAAPASRQGRAGGSISMAMRSIALKARVGGG